jgi:hypothetical protein
VEFSIRAEINFETCNIFVRLIANQIMLTLAGLVFCVPGRCELFEIRESGNDKSNLGNFTSTSRYLSGKDAENFPDVLKS